MKQKIEHLLDWGGDLRLNEYCSLSRSTWNNRQQKEEDVLIMRFRTVYSSITKDVKIKSRDYEGILKEVGLAMEQCFFESGKELAKWFRHGRLG